MTCVVNITDLYVNELFPLYSGTVVLKAYCSSVPASSHTSHLKSLCNFAALLIAQKSQSMTLTEGELLKTALQAVNAQLKFLVVDCGQVSAQSANHILTRFESTREVPAIGTKKIQGAVYAKPYELLNTTIKALNKVLFDLAGLGVKDTIETYYRKQEAVADKRPTENSWWSFFIKDNKLAPSRWGTFPKNLGRAKLISRWYPDSVRTIPVEPLSLQREQVAKTFTQFLSLVCPESHQATPPQVVPVSPVIPSALTIVNNGFEFTVSVPTPWLVNDADLSAYNATRRVHKLVKEPTWTRVVSAEKIDQLSATVQEAVTWYFVQEKKALEAKNEVTAWKNKKLEEESNRRTLQSALAKLNTLTPAEQKALKSYFKA